jgi:leucyl-tRNA synthetase
MRVARRRKTFTVWPSSHTPAARSIWATSESTRLRTSSRGSSDSRASGCSTPWAGMPSDYRRRTRPSKEASVSMDNSAPGIWTEKNIQEMKKDLQETMLWMDWDREVGQSLLRLTHLTRHTTAGLSGFSSRCTKED